MVTGKISSQVLMGFLFLEEQNYCLCSSRFCFCPFKKKKKKKIQQQQKAKDSGGGTPDLSGTGFDSLRCRFLSAVSRTTAKYTVLSNYITLSVFVQFDQFMSSRCPSFEKQWHVMYSWFALDGEMTSQRIFNITLPPPTP